MPQRHLHRPGLGAGRLQAVVDDLQAQIDADVAPIVAHEIHGDGLGRLEIDVFQGQGERRAVRELAQAVAVLVAQADVVQKRAGTAWVVLRVGGGELRLEVAAARMRGHLPRHAAPEVDDLVHLNAVDGERERLPKALVLEEPAQALVRVVVVRLNRHVAGVQAVPDVNVHQFATLAELEQRNVLCSQVEGGEVQLAVGRARRHHFLVVHHFRIHAVDVGKLIASGIDLEVVGIAFQPQHLDRAADNAIGAQRRHPGALLDGPVAQRAEARHPSDEAARACAGVEFFPIDVFRMETLEVVLRIDEEVAELRDQVHEQRIGFGEDVAKGQLVEFLDASAEHPPRRHRRPFLVHPQIVEAEHEVVAGERLAVGPANALAQPQRNHAPVVAHLPGFGEVRQEAAHVRGDGERRFRGHELRQIGEHDSRRPAVATNAFVGNHDDWIIGKPLGDQRQRAIGNLPREVGALIESRNAGFACGLRYREPCRRPAALMHTDVLAFKRLGTGGSGQCQREDELRVALLGKHANFNHQQPSPPI